MAVGVEHAVSVTCRGLDCATPRGCTFVWFQFVKVGCRNVESLRRDQVRQPSDFIESPHTRPHLGGKLSSDFSLLLLLSCAFRSPTRLPYVLSTTASLTLQFLERGRRRALEQPLSFVITEYKPTLVVDSSFATTESTPPLSLLCTGAFSAENMHFLVQKRRGRRHGVGGREEEVGGAVPEKCHGAESSHVIHLASTSTLAVCPQLEHLRGRHLSSSSSLAFAAALSPPERLTALNTRPPRS